MIHIFKPIFTNKCLFHGEQNPDYTDTQSAAKVLYQLSYPSHVWLLLLFFHGLAALVALGLLIVEVPQSHSDTPNSVGLLWTSDRPVAEVSPDNTHHWQETNINAPGGIQTRNPSKPAAVNPRHRPDRRSQIMRWNTEVWSNNTVRPVAVWNESAA